jgi:HAD superfamily hydrolase (TIGR01509 family)
MTAWAEVSTGHSPAPPGPRGHDRRTRGAAPARSPKFRRPAALFDLDGVLWDSSEAHAWAFSEVCAEEGLQPCDYSLLAGRSTPDAWALILAGNSRMAEASELARLTAAKQAYARQRLEATRPLAADLHPLAALAADGFAIGLVTGASAASARIFLSGAGVHFDVVITAETATAGKPAPDPYLAAAGKLGIPASQCWALEDSAQGLRSALSAGARTVHLAAVLPAKAAEDCSTDMKDRQCGLRHPQLEACVADIATFARLIREGQR